MPALTANFGADFSAFETAVKEAEVVLKTFESSATKVEGSLNKMTDSFSGRKVIQDAELMTEAVTRLGGASMLTEKELARVGTTVGEAVTKMDAMGIDVPDRMRKLAAETKGVGSAAAFMGDQFKAVGGMLAGMFTIQSVLAFGGAVVTLSGDIKRMADQTGLAYDAVQSLMNVAGASSTPVGTLTSAMQGLTEAVGSGDTGVTAAIEDLGINLETFTAANMYDQTLMVSDAVRGLGTPLEQTTALAALYGNKWKEVAPAVLSDMRSVADGTLKLSADAVDAIDRWDRAWKNFKTNSMVIAGELAASLPHVAELWAMMNLNIKPGLMTDYAGAVDKTTAATTGAGDAAGVATVKQREWEESYARLNEQMQGQSAILDAIGPERQAYITNLLKEGATVTDLATVYGLTVPQIEAVRGVLEQNTAEQKKAEEAAKKLTEENDKWAATYGKVNEYGQGTTAILGEIDDQLIAHIQSLLQGGASVKDLADAYQLTVPQVQAMKTALEDWTIAMELNYAAQEETQSLEEALFDTLQERSGTATEMAITDIQRWGDNYKRQLMEAGTMTQEAYDTIDRIVAAKSANVMVNWTKVKSHSQEALQEIADKARADYEAMINSGLTFETETIRQFEETARKAQEAADNFGSGFEAGAERGKKALRDFGDEGERQLQRVTQQALSWSDAMDKVRAGEGTMSGALPSAGPGTMTSHGAWGSEEHKAWIAKMNAMGRYFGPVTHRGSYPGMPGYESGGPNIIGPDWEALGMTTPAGGTSWAMLGGKENAYKMKMPTWQGAYMAEGGAVEPGTPYVVGEQGPELFLPNDAGTILPNRGLGAAAAVGGVAMTNNFYINGTGADVARVVTAELTRLMRVGRKWPAV